MSHYKPYPAYRDSGVEWIGLVPEHWEVKRLKFTVASCKNGVWGDEPLGNDEEDIPWETQNNSSAARIRL